MALKHWRLFFGAGQNENLPELSFFYFYKIKFVQFIRISQERARGGGEEGAILFPENGGPPFGPFLSPLPPFPYAGGKENDHENMKEQNHPGQGCSSSSKRFLKKIIYVATRRMVWSRMYLLI